MITFRKEANYIILGYSLEFGFPWVFKKIEADKNVILKKTFIFTKDDLYPVDEEKPNEDEVKDHIINENDNYEKNILDDNTSFDIVDDDSEYDEGSFEEYVEFIFAHLENEYYKIESKILGIDISIFFYKDIDLSTKYFTAIRNISVFQKINNVVKEDLYIGGDHPNNIPLESFINFIENFPNSYELTKYVDARLSAVLRNYFDDVKDGEQKYNNYMNKKMSKKGKNLTTIFQDTEKYKYETILQKLQSMLDEENSYNEKQWQNEILQIFLLLNPKYIQIFNEVQIKDTYSNKNRSLDFLLVDTTGNIDIIEIKRPFDSCIVTKNTYRNNYIPLRELSGTVMQIEKYIFYLNKWGKKGEEKLTEKYKDELPDGLKIKITNPSGIIIMGREKGLSEDQLNDFEVIKRKYKNVVDIVTYDDLLNRLKFTIEQFKLSKE